MKKARLHVWLALLVAGDATASPVRPLPPIEDRSQVFSLTDRVISDKGGVSCKSPEAARVGLDMLERGGNAVDAMVASGLASCVTSAGMRTIGGYGGAMVVHLKKIGKPIVVDFNSYAPLDLNASMFASQAAFGTDSGANPARVPGWAEHRELELMVKSGLSPMQAITAATKGSAALLGAKDRGTIEKGKRADLVVLGANPLDDIANTKQLVAVWHDGREDAPPAAAMAPASR